MREIVFKGLNICTGESVQGLFVGITSTTGEFQSYIVDCKLNDFGEFKIVEVDENSVGEWTGFLDRNGIRIFEGDICDLNILDNDHSEVIICKKHGAYGFLPLDPGNTHPSDRRFRSFWSDDEEIEDWNVYMTVVSTASSRGISLDAVEAKVKYWRTNSYKWA